MASTAVLIGLRAKATAIPVPSSMRSVCSAASSRGRNGSCPVSAHHSAVESVLLGPLRRRDGVARIEPDTSVDLHRRTLSEAHRPHPGSRGHLCDTPKGRRKAL